MLLDPQIAEELRTLLARLDAEGKLLPRARLCQCYDLFRERFGPDVLASLEGEDLLLMMHERGGTDSLVYWLEYKNDEELPDQFGSISGGSAYNYDVFYSADRASWITGSPRSPQEITKQEAISIAVKQRDELVQGAAVLQSFTPTTDDAAYAEMGTKLSKVAPTVSGSAWGHKYFSLQFPEILDDFHNPDYARYHLIKLLQLPPTAPGRYGTAGRFVALAQQFSVPINNITTLLNFRNGRRPCTYWRIGTREGDTGPSHWEQMQAGNYIAIGWPELGNLSAVRQMPDNAACKEQVKSLVRSHYYQNNESAMSNQASQITAFLSVASRGDITVAMNGAEVLGIGRITGTYRYQQGAAFPHQLPVDWLSFDRWNMNPPERLRTTFRPLGKHAVTLVDIEKRIYQKEPIQILTPPLDTDTTAPPPLVGIPARVEAALQRKGQVILYGPPGTGKTYWAEIAANELAARSWYAKSYRQLSDAERTDVGADAVRIASFHPAYGYEDFLEGYRPELVQGQMVFARRDGVFKKLCAAAEARPERNFYLIIDEINRGDIPRIFGELITVLEKNKRGKSVLLPLSGDPFRVPPNVFVIGTMNTADRSIALLDAALRRRFGFLELLPDGSTLGQTVLEGLPLRLWLEALNRSIVARVGRDARNLQIGHSYFLTETGEPLTDFDAFSHVLREDILPLLQEYCYEDYGMLEAILGQSLVDVQALRIREELFARDRQSDLVAALIAPHPELATVPAVLLAVTNDTINAPDDPDDEDNGADEDPT